MSTIMACDPSLTAWGYSIIENNNMIDFGVIKTESRVKKLRIRAGDDRVRRCMEIADVLNKVIDKHNVVHIVSELPHGSQNSSAAFALGMVTAIMATLTVCRKVSVDWYSELDGKKAITGHKPGKITKQDVLRSVTSSFGRRGFYLLKDEPKYVKEAVADSLAIYEAALHDQSTLKMLLNKDDK